MRTSEIAYRAAELVSEFGLAKHTLWDRTGAFCLNGAVCAAAHGTELLDAIRKGVESQDFDFVYAFFDSPLGCTAAESLVRLAAVRVLAGRGHPVSDPSFWNNREETTQEDVIQLLKETGYALEQQEREGTG